MTALANIDFGFYLSLFWRRLPVFLIVSVVAAAVCAGLTMLMPISYQATATILVESPQIPTDLAKSTVPTGAGEQFQIIQQDVLSRASLLALADRFGIYANHLELSRTDMFDDMTRRVGIVPITVDNGSGTGATVYSISFKADRPDVAANLVNDLVTMILNKDVQLRTARATDTVNFFTKETQDLDGQLRDLDSRVLAFKNANINALPDSVDFRRNQQTALQLRLLSLAQEETTLRRQQTNLLSRPLDSSTVALSPEEQNLQALRQTLAQQQALFAETSPTIVALRGRIAAIATALNKPATDGNSAPLSARDTENADITDRLAAIAAERASIEKNSTDLATSINATPGNETALNSMLRDHQNLQAQYDAATARLAEASTGQQIELLLKGERLSLIESAEPPTQPQGPKQKLLLAGSGLIGLLLGLAVIVAPEFLNRRIRRPAELVSRLQITPFITVPYIEQRSERGYRLAAGLGSVTLIPAVLALFHGFGSALKDIATRAQTSFSSTKPRL